jgi:iron complex outermembrane receptor protein
VRASFGVRRYRHDELEGEEVGTKFKNDTTQFELLANTQPLFGRLQGSYGVSGLVRAFAAEGEEALAPPIDQNNIAAFTYQELPWSHVTLQFGGRLDRVNYEPAGEDRRDFTTGSGSFGVLFRPAAADDRVTVALSLARAARAPALEELFYFGPHPGNFAFEIGNPDLDPEHAVGFDLSLRWRGARASGEVTYFRNDIQDFVFTAPLSEAEFEAREAEFEERFAARAHGEEEEGEEHAHGEFPFIEYVGADSVLQGIEAHGDFALTPQVFLEAQLDYVRGTLKDSDEPLPRMPPLRVGAGLRYQRNAFQAGAHIRVAATQDRLFSTETETDGSQLLRLFASYTFGQGTVAHTITGRLDNATDELYRNHLSLIKDLAPEMGRNFRLLYNVRF